MRMSVFCLMFLAVPVVSSVWTGPTSAQIPSSYGIYGQNVVPVYEGWRKNADGTYTMFFGYFNRNTSDRVNIPVGASNSFDPPPVDRGGPTHFYPLRQRYVFEVKVPKDWGNKDLVWMLTSAGKTEKAYGTLRPIYEVDNQLIAKAFDGGRFGLVLANSDEPPSITVEPVQTQLGAGRPLTLTAFVRDDGVPAPTPRTTDSRPRAAAEELFLNVEPLTEPRRPQGLFVRWIQLRGPGMVIFEPEAHLPVTNGGKVSIKASFKEPGRYILRAIASDTLLYSTADAQVTVTP